MKTKKEKKVREPKRQAELAAVLGISEQLLSYYIQKGDAPPISDVGAWLEHLSVASREGSMDPDIRRKLGEARLGLLEAQTSKINLDNKDRQGGSDSVPRQVTAEIIFNFAWKWRIAIF